VTLVSPAFPDRWECLAFAVRKETLGSPVFPVLRDSLVSTVAQVNLDSLARRV
jgi:hypothetical protein